MSNSSLALSMTRCGRGAILCRLDSRLIGLASHHSVRKAVLVVAFGEQFLRGQPQRLGDDFLHPRIGPLEGLIQGATVNTGIAGNVGHHPTLHVNLVLDPGTALFRVTYKDAGLAV